MSPTVQILAIAPPFQSPVVLLQLWLTSMGAFPLTSRGAESGPKVRTAYPGLQGFPRGCFFLFICSCLSLHKPLHSSWAQKGLSFSERHNLAPASCLLQKESKLFWHSPSILGPGKAGEIAAWEKLLFHPAL